MKNKPHINPHGESFIDKYCMKCIHCDPDPSGDIQCSIFCAGVSYRDDEPGYPEEWQYKNGKPICIKHKKWDWNEMGNPHDSNNPNYIMPYNPNQTELFS